MPLFLDFIKANGLVAFNQMLLKRYGAMLPTLESSASEMGSAGAQLDALEQTAKSPGFEYGAEEWAAFCDKLHSFYLRRDKSKLVPSTLNKFQEFVRAKGVAKFNDVRHSLHRRGRWTDAGWTCHVRCCVKSTAPIWTRPCWKTQWRRTSPSPSRRPCA